ncbi:MAG: insulinase family protein [Gemmatimonadetes bacterium]|nr:insulinase family protein [Gemmatimonadota bacterium]
MPSRARAGRTVERFAFAELENGLVVLTEAMPGVHSAALGVWVRFGSVHEQPGEMGVSHLLEHMVFKGTRRRTAREIALVLERLGGSLDAYTTREHTSYQARVLDEHLDTALEVLADLVLGPLLRPEDLELEREVVLEEISTVEDTPDDLVFELHASALWGDHPYGYSILGTPATVGAAQAEDLKRVHERGYGRPNLIVAAAGGVGHERVLERVAELFAPARNGAPRVAVPPAEMQPPREVRVERATAQTHLVFGTQTFGHSDPRRIGLVLASTAFGGGMSSRLFQRVREELGLAYSVYSFQSFYSAAGVSGVYVGTRHEWADRAAGVVREELSRIAREGLTAEELEDVKSQVKGQMVLSLESSGARLHRLAGFRLYDEPFLTVEELMARVDAVTREAVAELTAEYFDPARQLVLRLGPAT